jgi:CRISPR-associated protein Csd1
MDNRGRVTNLERLIGKIVGNFFAFPANLTLDEQGRFAIGYYHQRQDFFTKREENK